MWLWGHRLWLRLLKKQHFLTDWKEWKWAVVKENFHQTKWWVDRIDRIVMHSLKSGLKIALGLGHPYLARKCLHQIVWLMLWFVLMSWWVFPRDPDIPDAFPHRGGCSVGWDTVWCTYEEPILSYWSLCHPVLSLLSPAEFAGAPDSNLGDKEWWGAAPELLSGGCAPQAYRLGAPKADRNPAFH